MGSNNSSVHRNTSSALCDYLDQVWTAGVGIGCILKGACLDDISFALASSYLKSNSSYQFEILSEMSSIFVISVEAIRMRAFLVKRCFLPMTVFSDDSHRLNAACFLFFCRASTGTQEGGRSTLQKSHGSLRTDVVEGFLHALQLFFVADPRAFSFTIFLFVLSGGT